MNAAFIECAAGVRYWEDAIVNGVEDEDGSRIPCRVGDYWCPTIDLRSGTVVGWPGGTTADIHYKVCDDGEYWLLNEAGERIAAREGYVPNSYLCHGNNGYGDYIIMTVGPDGKIAGFNPPNGSRGGWKFLSAPELEGND